MSTGTRTAGQWRFLGGQMKQIRYASFFIPLTANAVPGQQYPLGSSSNIVHKTISAAKTWTRMQQAITGGQVDVFVCEAWGTARGGWCACPECTLCRSQLESGAADS